jgi:redox-sensitive bicupin YhaK (pirin superfamily)
MEARQVQRVTAKVNLGGDQQVDDKNIVIMPSYESYPLTDPFLVLAEDWFSSPGFEWHPHRGIDTVTLVLDGVAEHGDNLGNAGVLEAGDTQWMTAGRGIIHRELAYRNEHAHTLQLWINLPAALKMTETRYQDIRFDSVPVLAKPGVQVRTIGGGAEEPGGSAVSISGAIGMTVTLDPNTSYAQLLPADHRVFAYVLRGGVTIGDRVLRSGEIGWSDPVDGSGLPGHLVMNAQDSDEQTVVLLFSGRPLNEPVAMGGPFVMNTQQEIAEAMSDFHRGEFGQIPRTARLATR